MVHVLQLVSYLGAIQCGMSIEQGVGQRSGSRQNVRAPPVCDDDADDPYEVYGEGEDDDDDDGLEMDD
ncbi:hypothetical protein MTR_6g029280 [Medicago truncatula]|uniref:Uncharacterized protein n=1 Tax=Medicago truncatula TaxID=3880 RepID=G7KPL7_MEDTR|nr:hypothetical protein MTR_6g029280 [Medicago truncatula]